MAKINHTAAQIDAKLDLINENKNWLPYRYKYSSLSAGLEDVGDGSFLTTATITSQVEIPLATDCLLPEGSYTVSVDVTDIADAPASNDGFSLEIDGVSKTEHTASASPISISLVIPQNTSAGLLIKPMIRKSGTEADWKPFMDNIGTYVDERFNSTNAKIKVLIDRINQLEDLLSDGVVLLAEKPEEQV